MEMETEMASRPSDVSVGLLSCNNLISQRRALTALNECCALFIRVKFYDKPSILLCGSQWFVNV